MQYYNFFVDDSRLSEVYSISVEYAINVYKNFDTKILKKNYAQTLVIIKLNNDFVYITCG